jgi:hypothetical protein
MGPSTPPCRIAAAAAGMLPPVCRRGAREGAGGRGAGSRPGAPADSVADQPGDRNRAVTTNGCLCARCVADRTARNAHGRVRAAMVARFASRCVERPGRRVGRRAVGRVIDGGRRSHLHQRRPHSVDRHPPTGRRASRRAWHVAPTPLLRASTRPQTGPASRSAPSRRAAPRRGAPFGDELEEQARSVNARPVSSMTCRRGCQPWPLSVNCCVSDFR